MMKPKSKRLSRNLSAKLGECRVSEMRLDDIQPSPENDKIYGPVDPKAPSVIALSKSIRRYKLRPLEPIVVTLDGYILSGHRRYAACKLAGLKVVRVRIEQIRRSDDIDAFVVLLREYNRQRVKSIDVLLREAIIDSNPVEARAELIAYRRKKSKLDHDPISLGVYRARSEISDAKQPFLDAIKSVLDAMRDYWPLSDRQVHYALLNDPPLRHAAKAGSTYRNDKASYKSLIDLLTRGRVAGLIPYQAIGDETRPFVEWDTHPEVGSFIQKEIDDLFKDYYRPLLQSQPNHIEVVVEKNTVAGLIKTVCRDFTMKMTSGRGYCSLAPRYELAQRFRASGKEKLIVVMVSDFDPEGESIVESFGRSMRDDFDIDAIHIIKAALTAEQIKEYGLPPAMEAKASSSRTKGFVAKHGTHVWELEALPPATLQDIVRNAIVNVLDMDLFEQEQQAESDDAAKLEAIRKTVCDLLRDVHFDGEGL